MTDGWLIGLWALACLQCSVSQQCYQATGGRTQGYPPTRGQDYEDRQKEGKICIHYKRIIVIFKFSKNNFSHRKEKKQASSSKKLNPIQ